MWYITIAYVYVILIVDKHCQITYARVTLVYYLSLNTMTSAIELIPPSRSPHIRIGVRPGFRDVRAGNGGTGGDVSAGALPLGQVSEQN